MRPHTDAGFGALSDERGAYLPAERPSAASSAARLAATQQQRCRASTAPASQRRPRHPPSRARQGATVDARRLKAPRASHCSFFPPTHPACAGEFLGCAAASMSSATHAQRRLSTQHKQWRAQQTGGGIASRQQLHTRTNGGNGRARVHSSCSSGGGGGSYSCHRPPHHWRRGAARSASRLTPSDWAHAPRGAAGDLICSNPP